MASDLCDEVAAMEKRWIERHIAAQERLKDPVDYRKMSPLDAAKRAVDRLIVLGWCR